MSPPNRTQMVWGTGVLILFFLAMFAVVRADDPVPRSAGYARLSFEDADIRKVIKSVGEMTGKRFLLDEDVQGSVTIVTPDLPLADVDRFISRVLEIYGFVITEQEGLFRVSRIPGGSSLQGAMVGPDEEMPESGLVTKLFQLQYVSASDVLKMLQPLRGEDAGAGGALAVLGSTNHLLVTDTAAHLRRLQEILHELDRPGSSRVAEVIRLKHADADSLAQRLNQALAGMEGAGSRFSRQVRQAAEGSSIPSGTVVIPLPQAQSVIVAGAPAQCAEVLEMITKLDVEMDSGAGNLHVIFLKYLDADDGAKSLNNLLAKTVGEKEQSGIAIEPSSANNALLIHASPRDYQLVSDLVFQLDHPPQQVMVEVMIAEVTAGDDLELGVEWSSVETPQEGRTTFVGRSRPSENNFIGSLATNLFFPQGLSLALATGLITNSLGQAVPAVPAFLRALAEDREVKILSNVPLWAQNNKEASVSVVDNIPVLTSTIEGGAGTSRDVIQNIERMDVGIKLTLTPHVNPQNDITVELNPSIEAVVDQGPSGAFSPTIARREVSTTVTVPDRATVVISGLMREDSIEVISKIPILGDIPLLGFLFRNTSTQKQKSNLLIFVTPTIVTDMDAANAMRNRFELKTGLGDEVDQLMQAENDDEAAADD